MRYVGLVALAEGEEHLNCYILFYVIYAVCVVCAGFVVIENTVDCFTCKPAASVYCKPK